MPEPYAERPDPDLIATRADFSRELSRLREQAGLTVRDVARAVGIRDSTAGGYFSGRHLPGARSQGLLAEIVRVCGLDDPVEVERWMQALVRVRRSPGPRPAGEPAPYLGLATFEAEDERWFHGREALTRLVVDRVRGARTPLVVTGPSGSGKSSLLRAGLVPALRRERRSDGTAVWDCRVLVPGNRPLDRLRAELPAEPGATLVLVVDQFEEVFTAGSDPRSAVAEAVAEIAENARVVLGLRADFWAAAAAQPALVPALQDGQVVVGPMTAVDLRRAITEPARLAALDLEDGLVEVILRDAAPRGDAGTLPLLSHALLATWRRGQRGRLTVADYLGSGGIAGAIAQTAESIYQQLDPDEQDLSRRLFLRLVHVDDDAADTRRRVPRGELEDFHLLDRYVEQRLVTVDSTTVEIAHEALLSAWPRLREWVDADRAGLRVHRQLTDAAAVWQQTDRDPNALLRGGRLAAAGEWAADPDHRRALNQAERDFLGASTAAAVAERSTERGRARRLRTLLAAACALLLLAGALTGYLFQQRRVADRQRDEAISRRVATDADRLRDVDRNLAMQLALAAYRITPTPEARSSLVDSSAVPDATRLLAGPGVLQAVAMTPDGRTVAAGGSDGQVRLWDLAGSGRPQLAALTGSTGKSPTVFAVTASPDGRMLATGGSDGLVRLWDLADRAHPRPLATVIGSTGVLPTVFAIAVAPDGRTLAAGGADGRVRLWSLADPAHLRAVGTLAGPRGYVQALAFSPDGGMLAAGSIDKNVYRWDLRRPGPPLRLAGATKAVLAVAFSPDGRLLAAGSADKQVHLWSEPASPRPVAEAPLTGPTSWVNAVAFSPDGGQLAGGGSDNAVRLWSLAGDRGRTPAGVGPRAPAGDGRPIATLPHPGPVTAVRFADGGRTLATSAADGAVRLWQLPGPVLAGPTDSVFSVQFTAGGNRLAVAGGTGDNAVRIWDVRDPRAPTPAAAPVLGPPDAQFTGAMVVSPDGRTIATGSTDGTVRLWRGGAATVLHGPTAVIQSLAFSPHGDTLAAGGNDHRVWLWQVADPRRPIVLTGATNYVYGVTFDPSGRYLAAGSADDLVRIWDLRDPGDPLTTLSGPASYVFSVAFSPDGATLAAGSADSKVWLWNVAQPAHPVAEPPLTGPSNYVFGVTFNRSGSLLAAAAGDRTVWAWDTSEGGRPRLLLRLTGAGDSVLTADFRPDGAWLAAGTADNTVRLWNLDPEQVADYVCATAGDPLTRAEWDRYVTGVPYRPPCPRA